MKYCPAKLGAARVLYTTILLTGPSSGHDCDNGMEHWTTHKRYLAYSSLHLLSLTSSPIKSLLAKPSLVAFLAKSNAQSGQELYDAAIETLNVALENRGQEEKDFVDVIKVRMHLHDPGRRDTVVTFRLSPSLMPGSATMPYVI